MMKDILSLKYIQGIAGEPSYSRGVEYVEEGRVTNIRVEEDCITATVRGTRPYRVKLWEADEELEYSCTCPFHRDQLMFCKHCVAVGLASLQIEEKTKGQGRRKRRQSRDELSMEDVKEYLETQDKASLISLLLQHANDDERLKARLMMKAGKKGKKIHLPTFRKMIDQAVDWGDFVDYKSMYEYSQGIEDVIASLRELFEEKRADEVIELSEHFLQSLEAQIGMMDDSDGYMSDILSEIQELHHAACLKARPDPEKLARKLFEWELRSEWEVFYGAAQQYADVLGKRGLDTYCTLAEAKWDRVPPLGPGEDGLRYSGERYRITRIMERLASQTGDIEKLVEVKTRDLSLAYSYLEIAELYRKAGKADDALEWAEKGVRAFPKRTDSRLREFLANEYHKRKRHAEAMQLIWAEFADFSGVEQYKLLKSHAERAGGQEIWKQWRERALQFIREDIGKAKRTAQKNRWAWNGADHSTLIQIFLWEKNVEAAWQEAQEGGCKESLWLELAAEREADHPEDALAVYQSVIEPMIERKNNESYNEAIGYVKKVDALFRRLGKKEDWD